MSMIYRLLLSSLLLVILAIATATSAVAQKRQFDIPFNNDTKDLHFQISNPVVSFKITPPPNSTENHGTSNRRSLAWNTAPGAATRRIEIEREGGGKWNLKVWPTTDGVVNVFPGGPATHQFAGLFIGVDSGLASIFGENDTPAPVSLSNLAATLVVDLGTLANDNWPDATGSIVSLPDAIIPAGAEDFLLGSFALGSATWLKLTANLDGQSHVFGEVAVPEPATLALFGIAALALLGYRGRSRNPA
jgi:hypothetical protein